MLYTNAINKQHKGKSETTFNLRLNNHRKDVSKQNSLQAYHINTYNLNKPPKFTLIEQLNDTNIDK